MFRISIEADASVLEARECDPMYIEHALEMAGLSIDGIWVEIVDEEALDGC